MDYGLFYANVKACDALWCLLLHLHGSYNWDINVPSRPKELPVNACHKLALVLQTGLLLACACELLLLLTGLTLPYGKVRYWKKYKSDQDFRLSCFNFQSWTNNIILHSIIRVDCPTIETIYTLLIAHLKLAYNHEESKQLQEKGCKGVACRTLLTSYRLDVFSGIPLIRCSVDMASHIEWTELGYREVKAVIRKLWGSMASFHG